MAVFVKFPVFLDNSPVRRGGGLGPKMRSGAGENLLETAMSKMLKRKIYHIS